LWLDFLTAKGNGLYRACVIVFIRHALKKRLIGWGWMKM